MVSRTDIFSYTVERLDHHTREAGKLRMAAGQARLTSKVTQESEVLTFCVVHFGDHEVIGGVQNAASSGYHDLLDAINSALDRADIPEVIRFFGQAVRR